MKMNEWYTLVVVMRTVLLGLRMVVSCGLVLTLHLIWSACFSCCCFLLPVLESQMAFFHFHDAQNFGSVGPKVLATAEDRRLLRLELDQGLLGIIRNAAAALGQVIDRHVLGRLKHVLGVGGGKT
jgi:hypothetical protein